MPDIMEGSILIMSRAGTGTAMFSMGEIIDIYIHYEPKSLNLIHLIPENTGIGKML